MANLIAQLISLLLDRPVNVGLHLTVLDQIFLVHLLDAGLDCICFLVEAVLERLGVLVDDADDLLQGALP